MVRYCDDIDNLFMHLEIINYDILRYLKRNKITKTKLVLILITKTKISVADTSFFAINTLLLLA